MASRSSSSAGPTKPAASSTPATAPAPDLIAQRAYEKWCQRGCPLGSDQVDWYEAEQELRGENLGPRRQAKA
jgi:hypothetical protein